MKYFEMPCGCNTRLLKCILSDNIAKMKQIKSEGLNSKENLKEIARYFRHGENNCNATFTCKDYY